MIGLSGSGKITIIKLIAGLLRPTAGKIIVGGFDVVEKPVEAKSIIGYIPGEPVIWRGLTGEEFLHFTGALYKMTELTRQGGIKKLLDVFSLAGIEKTTLKIIREATNKNLPS